MAGDWIKLEIATPDKPEIDQIADFLGIDHDAVMGKLVRLWIWADQQSVDGNALSVTKKMIGRITFAEDFADALLSCGWLSGQDGRFTIPNFELHNGKSAKSRALTNRRVSKSRKCNGASVTPSVTEAYQKALPEKRREEKSIIPPNPQGGKREKSDNLPSSPFAIRISELFHRKLSTKWSDKEIRAFKAIPKEALESIELVCRYTEAERAKGEQGRHRRDLATFLNNFTGELDRARERMAAKPAAKQFQFID